MSRGDPNGAIRGEFLEAYLGEVDELLNSANGLLLAIDAPQRNREPTPRQVRDLFRAMHTVKGLSAMVGVEPVVSLAHRAEALLRSADRSGGLLRPGAVDLLLQAVRAIEQRVRALGQQKPVPAAPAALLDALDAIEEGVVPEPRAAPAALVLDPALDAKLAPFERQALARGVRDGKRVVCVRFAPAPALAAEGVTINSVRERLGSVAEIVKVVPVSVPRSDAAPAGLSFVLLVITPADDASIASSVGLDPSAIECLAEGAAPAVVVAQEAPERASSLDDEIADEELVHRNFVRVEVDRLDDTITELAQLAVSRAALGREIAKLAAKGVDVRDLNAVTRDQDRKARALRAAILRLRMVPVGDVFERVPLIVRGLRRSTGKSVRLEIEAGRAELDKAVADRIFPVIVHLVRNAVDHAIEAPDARVAAGKPTEGLVRITCRSRGNAQLELQVTDDGGGVNAAELARRAGRPLPTTNAALLQLLCRPGLSTRDEVTDTSGRGMGMDIVRQVVVDQLGGELTLETTPGVGTTFALRVPLTISIVDAFAFECGAQRFLVPLSTVDAIVEIDPAAVVSPPGRGGLALLSRRGESLPLVQLDVLFGLEDPRTIRTRPKAMIVRREDVALAFAFDRMLGQMEIVVRPLTDPLVNMRGIAGAADLGDGQPTLVVDLYALGARLADSGLPDRPTPDRTVPA
ncbi:MAG: chemotaxis protein CheW [Myxococcota bacterium]